MNILSGTPFQESGGWSKNSTEAEIYRLMNESSLPYSYRYPGELNFEMTLRNSIVESAKAMHQSAASFATFETTRVNSQYWNMTEFGGFRIKPGVRPSDAIRDIFTNGSYYGFECAGAMLIIYYDAVLRVLGERTFNQLFPDIFIYSWHADSDLGIHPTRTMNFLTGDVVYFENPDFDPRTPHWRGENAVVLGGGLYFGHGIGIMTAEQMIQALNSTRRPGAFQSAYLSDLVVRPSFQYLSNFATGMRSTSKVKYQSVIVLHNEDSIPLLRYRMYLTMIYQG
ncbi:protein-glutamine gamma-glutamyltransferase [Halobacillus campisalis]|uniref:Protein-glutamine gamma-glutamyltransferase n=1 Tax=Halobacillus campisalis TaxID=435909 RepID=A0ABW2K8V0_9BACI|nr:protein-glutamine gamma-glutamyltransferase [Halobacillus campisalis]